jgi:hypothetical protein
MLSKKDAQAIGEAFSPALQNIKYLYFFLIWWVIFALMDPDPHFECGSMWIQNLGETNMIF